MERGIKLSAASAMFRLQEHVFHNGIKWEEKKFQIHLLSLDVIMVIILPF